MEESKPYKGVVGLCGLKADKLGENYIYSRKVWEGLTERVKSP